MSYRVKPRKIQYRGTVRNSNTVSEAQFELYQGFRKIGDIYYSPQTVDNTLTTFAKDKDGTSFHEYAKKFYHSNKIKTVIVNTGKPEKEENYILWYANYLALSYFEHKGLLNKIEYYTSGEAFGITYSEFSGKEPEDSR